MRITRIIAVFATLAVIAVFASGCKKSEKLTVESIESSLTESISFPEMVSLNEKQLLNYYTFPEKSFEDFSVNLAKEEEKSDEYAIFLLNKGTDRAEIISAITLHSANRTVSFKQFPAEEEKLQNNIVRTNDKIIVYVVTSESELASEILEELGFKSN